MKFTRVDAPEHVTFLALEGSLNIAGAKEIRGDFLEVIQSRAKPVILDLSQVDFLASFGMRLLIEAHKSVGIDKHAVVLLNPQPSVARVLESAGLSSVIASASSVEEAYALAK
jgi:anti-sigma B factor antagonist